MMKEKVYIFPEVYLTKTKETFRDTEIYIQKGKKENTSKESYFKLRDDKLQQPQKKPSM